MKEAYAAYDKLKALQVSEKWTIPVPVRLGIDFSDGTELIARSEDSLAMALANWIALKDLSEHAHNWSKTHDRLQKKKKYKEEFLALIECCWRDFVGPNGFDSQGVPKEHRRIAAKEALTTDLRRAPSEASSPP